MIVSSRTKIDKIQYYVQDGSNASQRTLPTQKHNQTESSSGTVEWKFYHHVVRYEITVHNYEIIIIVCRIGNGLKRENWRICFFFFVLV